MALAVAAAACGGDDDDTAAAPGAVATAATAADLISGVTTLGWKPVPAGPGFAETATSKVALYENPGSKVTSLRLEVTIAPTADGATAQFAALADALKNPPPDLFGGNTVQVAGTAVYQADQSRSYKTDKPDKEGTLVFSDIHRFGRAIVIMYAIGPAGADTEAVRKQVAEVIAPKAPR